MRRAAWLCTLAGALLGSVVLLLDGAGDFTRFLVFLTLGAMVSAASTTLAPIPRAAQGYIGGALVLPTLFWLYQGRLEYGVLAGLALSMLVFLVRNARLSHDAFLEGLGRAREIAELREQFQAERDEWLDLSQATEAFALLDPGGRLLLWNSRFEALVHPAVTARGVFYSELLGACAAKPTSVDGQPIAADAWLALRCELGSRGGALLEGYAGDVFYRVAAHRTPSGREVVTAVNVSALERAERALHDGQLALLQAQRLESVGIIAGRVAHDSVGLAFVGAVVGEYLGSAMGVGYLIHQAEGVFDTNTVVAGIIVLTVCALCLDAAVTRVERRHLHWRPQPQGESTRPL
jgi:hypothetical protein